MAAILSALLLAIPLSEGLSERTRDSAIANRLTVYAERLEGQLRPVFGEAIARTLNLLTIRPDSNERVNFPFTVATTRPRPDLEKRMLDLVNQERQAAGLRPLAADPELTEVARRHSADMFARGYFAHDTPEGITPFDRMRDANVRFIIAGENLALAPTIPVAHTGSDEFTRPPCKHPAQGVWTRRDRRHGRWDERVDGESGVSELVLGGLCLVR